MNCPCCGLPDLSAIYAMTERTAAGCEEWMGARTKAGYGRIGERLVHRLVVERLIGPLPAKIEVLHTCDNPPCIRRDHLFVGTQADNVRDMWEKGRGKGGTLRGSQIGSAKLDEARVGEIKRLLREGATTYALATQFQVSRRAISLIKNGVYWRHVA